MLEVNQTYTHEFSFSQSDVEVFAKVSGDTNPLHLDAEFAAKTIFRKPIIHGFLGGSVFSKILGTQFPGEGSIYLKQSMEFLQPMFVEVVYEAIFTVLEILPKSSARIETKIIDKETQKVVTTGEAVVMNRQLIPKV
jgi:acyl dehydratase